MANFKKHATVGAAVGGGLNLLWQLNKISRSPDAPSGFWDTLRRIDFLEVAAFALLGTACASLPDILEPATNPNHRAFFHSAGCGGAVFYGAFGKHTERWSKEHRTTARTAALSFLSHLALDAGTPKGLPLL
jgi:membrane-bound metal-dependent hydrolase YbcI (DUF457 family)